MKPHYRYIKALRGEDFKDACFAAHLLEKAGEIKPYHDLINDSSCFNAYGTHVFLNHRSGCGLFMRRLK